MARYDRPLIVNTDQGCQFISAKCGYYVRSEGLCQSMNGRGRWMDNVVIERFWRTIKYEDIYLKSYENPVELAQGIGECISRYNSDRPYQSLMEWRRQTRCIGARRDWRPDTVESLATAARPEPPS
ncbi:MAG: integrase core domain-containing protein [Desulfobulbaceae bacterium]|nr:integrase core domain-containing protein [Desulfobulbaceae bacterium]